MTMRRDIEETEEMLDTYGSEPIDFWERKQKELVTSVVDYNLSTLADLISQEVIDLSPEYQRRFRWDKNRQSKLIESFLMNVPVPPIFLNEDIYGKYSVIDGKQRLFSVLEFFRGRLVLEGLTVFSDINGRSFDDLPSELQRILRTRPTLRAVIILKQSDQDVKYEVFQRLNTGGMRANPQEIRNSAFPGPLNNLILSLSGHPEFHELLGIRNKSRSSIYQEMRDAEFVLRFFAFQSSWNGFSVGMKKQMDDFLANNQYAKPQELESLKLSFVGTIDTVRAAFGERAFKRWQPEKEQWRNQVLASLFDAEMFACAQYSREQLVSKENQIIEGMKNLFGLPEFRRSIDAATNTPSYFRSRIELVSEMIRRAISE